MKENFIPSTLEMYQSLVGGLIARAQILENGDELYVNEEGLFVPGNPVWLLPRGEHFVGPAFVIGGADEEGEFTDANSTVEEIQKLIQFTNGRTT